MKSIGEIMAIGRNFGESFQKAISQIVTPFVWFQGGEFENLSEELAEPIDRHCPAVVQKFELEGSLFALDRCVISRAKKLWLSDEQIALAVGSTGLEVRVKRRNFDFIQFHELGNALNVLADNPAAISKFIEGAQGIDADSVAANGKVLVHAVLKHVENAGTHSGDATFVLPPQNFSQDVMDRFKEIAMEYHRNFHSPLPPSDILFGGGLNNDNLGQIALQFPSEGYKYYTDASPELTEYSKAYLPEGNAVDIVELLIANKRALREGFQKYDLSSIFNLAKAS
ncbi:Carbamoyl-phosphate synthase large chain [Wickerhamomyces ciferrii]|uniref:Carbamoyl-phosphate synthase large chain n=1 Tax=Wickerhamomyces ciferrii (strain ATCC 14091 / BCRC 22168 / CBS 111 / JCM 3599 / NBRC 0793 / NRRL Y-1031 F-60-10) TaxID=1206466 RepID=K0KNZ1_WICCF|nr:Carbamoyl-phosphate synthase large chain [Wickerhamomyces ciferrii]CCH46995.1 Carbamoyl-phosphate synthase large chain [Wickerhamomyces ciferrii]